MNIVERVKDIADLVKKYNDQDLYERIVALREQILELREENMSLRENNEALSNAAAIQKKLVHYENNYFLKDDTERKHPYCTFCWDYEHKLISLQITSRENDGEIFTFCNICHSRAVKGT